MYLSWLNYDDNSHIPCRESTTPLEITVKGRACFNQLCVTCESEKLINLFGEILFKSHSDVLKYYAEYRNEARKELASRYNKYFYVYNDEQDLSVDYQEYNYSKQNAKTLLQNNRKEFSRS